jgi:hypothetical protein
MLDISIPDEMSAAPIEAWAVRKSGAVCVRLKGGQKEVRLTDREWDALLVRYRDSVGPSEQRLRRAIILTVPIAIFECVLFSIVPVFDRIGDGNWSLVPWLLAMLIAAGLPLWGHRTSCLDDPAGRGSCAR